MSTEEHTALVRRFIDGVNRQDVEAIVVTLSDDASNHKLPAGRDGFRRVWRNLFCCFPDWHWEIEEMVAEGDAVMCLVLMTGTHLGKPEPPGPYADLVGVAPTGKPVSNLQSHFFRVMEGAIIAHRATRDDLTMFRQLGFAFVPPMDGGEEETTHG